VPRKFTEAERHAIRERLRQSCRRALAHAGLRRTRVEELARSAGISKGAFYLFYSSREALFLDVLAAVETEVRRELELRLQAPWRRPGELIARFLRFQFEVLEREPALAVLTVPEEAALLLRSLPPEELARRQADDDRYFGALFSRWREEGVLAAADDSTLASLPRVVLALLQQRDMIGRDRFPAVADLLVESLSRRLAGDRGAQGSETGRTRPRRLRKGAR
jgi:AcrR family transcriptional regulator